MNFMIAVKYLNDRTSILGHNFWIFCKHLEEIQSFLFIFFFIRTHTGFNFLFSPYLAEYQAEGRAINKCFKIYCDYEHEF